jgi:phosphoribosylformylglycinamidine synthase II
MQTAEINLGMQEVTLEEALHHGLKKDEFERIVARLGRVPNFVELGLFSAMWSEHCSYKSTRIHLKKRPTTAPWVICGPGENAGVISIGDGQAIIFKMESHNHPSYIEPFQGAATGVGGILRDVFTMGARPIALLNALRFGEASHPKTAHLLNGVVSGIGSYGNCVGVPTVGGECTFHACYNDNILVNAMCVGLVESDRIFYSAASDVGASVMYVGSKTGRDGIHGASMSSAEFDENSEDKRPTVQVGDPFTEKLLIEACLELMAKDAILSIQDMGAAGLTSSALEMASKGGTGIELTLDAVPMREAGMTPYELMLSESQERMLMVIKPGKESVAEAVFAKWELSCARIGVVTDTGRVVLKMHQQVVADLPIAPLADEAPLYERPWTVPEAAKPLHYSHITCTLEAEEILRRLMATPDLCSRRWIYEQYDNTVMGDTKQASDGDAALVRVHGSHKAVALTSDCTPRYCKANPKEGAKQAVAETYRNICAVGATPLAITNCLNFGNPEKPEIMGQIVAAIEGISEASLALDYPVVSGNVSLYNETNGKGVHPTPTIGGVGLLADISVSMSAAFKAPDQLIFVIGQSEGHMGASLFLREIQGSEEGDAPKVDLAQEKRHGALVRQLIADRLITACHDVSDGGLYVSIAEMAMASNIGAALTLSANDIPLWATLFGEDQGRYVITVAPAERTAVQLLAEKSGVTITEIGATIAVPELSVNKASSLMLSDLRTAFEATMPRIAEGV